MLAKRYDRAATCNAIEAVQAGDHWELLRRLHWQPRIVRLREESEGCWAHRT